MRPFLQNKYSNYALFVALNSNITNLKYLGALDIDSSTKSIKIDLTGIKVIYAKLQVDVDANWQVFPVQGVDKYINLYLIEYPGPLYMDVTIYGVKEGTPTLGRVDSNNEIWTALAIVHFYGAYTF